nr:hypothetical protein [Tanacetum cinerariifolium]
MPLPQMFINTMHIRPSSSGGTIVSATDLVKESGDMKFFMCFVDSAKLKRRSRQLKLAVQLLAWLATLPLLPFTMPAKGKYVIGKYAASNLSYVHNTTVIRFCFIQKVK